MFDPPIRKDEGCILAKSKDAKNGYKCKDGEEPNAFFYKRNVDMHFGDLPPVQQD